MIDLLGRYLLLLALAVLCALTPLRAGADVYYVDRLSGNDSWTGRVATAGSSDGPWQSLQRVARAALNPGDEIRLSCGQTWNETLRLSASGTAAAPIVVRAWPAPCATQPTIDGAMTVPSFLWTYTTGAKWRAPLDLNLIRNGDAQFGPFGWTIWSPTGNGKLGAVSGDCPVGTSPCLGATSGSGTAGQVSIVSSFTFPLDSALTYIAKVVVKAQAGVRVRVVVRRAGAPWDVLGGTLVVVGSGAWDTYTLSFRTRQAVKSARLDVELPPGGVTVGIDSVSLTPEIDAAREVFVDSESILPAHHPNRGHDPANPRSVYLPMARDGDARVRTVGAATKTGSSYLPLGPELVLPVGASLLNAKVRVRTTPWAIEEKRIVQVDAATASFDSDTDFPLRAGFGYFLTGARWMLDSPGEWFADVGANQLVVWMPDSQFPQERVSVSHLAVGLDLSGLANITVDGVRVTRTTVGVRLANTVSVTLNNCTIDNTIEMGVDLAGASSPSIQASRFRRTGGDAIGSSVPGVFTSGAWITGNDVRESGARVDGSGMVVSLPVPAFGAIRPGVDALVSNNVVSAAAYSGITPTRGGLVRNNSIENVCLTLDDCGGIYTFGANLGITIDGNVIRDLIGTNDGKPFSDYSVPHVVGIYLDENSSLAMVTNNTVTNAQYGIQLHNAFINKIQGNTLYGNRIYQIWLQEGSKVVRASGDVFGNEILGNIIVPTGAALGVSQDSHFSGTSAFAHYDRNVHSALLSPTIAREKWSGAEFNYTFAGWQAAKGADGTSRLLDVNGRVVAPVGYTTFEIAGGNLIPNSDFVAGLGGWARWNEIMPNGLLSLVPCLGSFCARLDPGGSPTLISSPNFTVVASQTYRLSVDVLASVDNQKLVLALRRGGGGANGYELLVDKKVDLFATTVWRRFTVIFKANTTVVAGDPATGDAGARLDIQQVATGQPILVRNMELVPLRTVGAVLRTRILSNSADGAVYAMCPDAEQTICSKYVRFEDASPVQWPMSIGPHSSQVVYTRDSALVDLDSDGIPDAQDSCPGTPAGSATNSAGCALGQ